MSDTLQPVAKTEGYHIPAKADFFEFDASVANVFDNMAARSIPGYRHFWDMVTNIIADRSLPHYTEVWDLGVSTGAGIDAVRRGLFHPYVDFFGVDISESMLAKAKERCPFARMSTHNLLEGLPSVRKGEVSVFILGWTLQFLTDVAARKRLLQEAADALHPDGIIFVGEKFSLADQPALDRILQDAYIGWRVQNGYTLEEIKAKTEALKGSMAPWTHADLVSTAADAGLIATPIYRLYSFGGYMLTKK